MAQETFTLTLNNATDVNVSVTINDTSVESSPTYNLSVSPSSANEGQTATWTLTTASVNAGTTLPYTISGISSAAIGGASLTGNFVVGSTMSRQITLTEDITTEGSETAVLSLNNGGASSSLVVNDTSIFRNIISTDTSGYQIKFATDVYTSPNNSRPQQQRLMNAMTYYGSTRDFRTVAFFKNNGVTDVLQAWYDWGNYSPGNSYVGGNYSTSISRWQVIMYVSGYTGTTSFYQINGSNGFDYDRIILYSGAYGSGQLAYINVP